MPRAKRRLFDEGPALYGHMAALMSVSILAAELRLHGVAQKDALAYLIDGFDDGYHHKERERRRIFKTGVAWAYKQDPPILTGCPRNSLSQGDTNRLRANFATYCDDACQAECRILRGARVPETALIGSAYEPLLLSTIWAVLGAAPYLVWRRMASLAVVDQNHGVTQASIRWLVTNLNGTLSRYQVKRSHALLIEHGLVRMYRHRAGKKQVIALSVRQVERLEDELQSTQRAKNRVADAVHEMEDRVLDFPEYALGI